MPSDPPVLMRAGEAVAVDQERFTAFQLRMDSDAVV